MDMTLLTLQTRFLKRRNSLFAAATTGDSASALDRVKNIIIRPGPERSDAQIAAIVAFTKGLKFFSDLRESVGEFAHEQCCRFISYAQIAAGKCVFREGDTGSQFYILLSGSCAVVVQTSKSANDFQLLTTLRPGDCFGELALISNKPRAATVFCRESSTFAVLERDQYSQILKQVQTRQIVEKIDLLKELPAFKTWRLSEIERLSHYFQQRNVRRRQSLFQAGQPATEIFLIQEGAFQITREKLVGSGKVKRRQSVIATVHCGALLCASTALLETTYDSSCCCVSLSGRALVIDAKNFKRVVTNEETVKALMEGTKSEGSSPEANRRSCSPASINRSPALQSRAGGERPATKSMQLVPGQLRLLPSSSMQFFHHRNPSLPQPSKPSEVVRKSRRMMSMNGAEILNTDTSIDYGNPKKSKLPMLALNRVNETRAKMKTNALLRNDSVPNLTHSEILQ